jgi:hypothetical protein
VCVHVDSAEVEVEVEAGSRSVWVNSHRSQPGQTSRDSTSALQDRSAAEC